MNQLIIVRHGSYDEDLNLSEAGKEEMKTLTRGMEVFVKDRTAVILSSAAPRAIQSANVLGEALGILVEKHEVLWSDNRHPMQLDKAVDLIAKYSKYEFVIVVTHLEYADDLPLCFVKKIYNADCGWVPLEKGEMRVIDCTEFEGIELEEDPLHYSEAEVEHISTGTARVRKDDALTYVKQIYECATPLALLNVYLFGSVASHGSGNDLDLVLEVSEPDFLKYVEECVGSLDGFHPIEKTMFPMSSMYWNYFSPAQARFEYALNAIGATKLDRIRLSRVIAHEYIDIICLPVRWNDSSNHVYNILRESFGIGGDPDTLVNIAKSCELIKR